MARQFLLCIDDELLIILSRHGHVEVIIPRDESAMPHSAKSASGKQHIGNGILAADPVKLPEQFKQNELDGYLAPAGHAVVKVNPGGFAFRLYTLSSQDESMRIIGIRDFLCC